MKLGNIVQSAGLTKSKLMQALHLGLGAAAFPFAYGFVQSKLLLKASPSMFAQNTPGEYAARLLSGLVLGAVSAKFVPKFGKEAALGVVAMAAGSVLKDLIAGWMNPAAAAQQAVVKAEETATGLGQMSGINPMGTGLAGLGYGNYGGRETSLYGVGTPDLSGAGMLNGANVSIESPGLRGATVAIESQNAFAGAIY